MTVPSRYWLAAALGLCMTHPRARLAAEAPPSEPARLGLLPGEAAVPSPNQRTANTIADQLRQSGQLRHYTVDIAFRDGVAEVSGSVADQPQREEVLRIVQGVPGVERVVDCLAVGTAIVPVQARAPQRLPDPLPRRGADAPPNGAVPEPAPVFQAPPPTPTELNPPRMPPYAWPTYAPYNNFSRVAYPLAYPYGAWPFIGIAYPFPKVPLGWRSVKLEWDDGHWWFSKTATKCDWWRLRYW